MTDLYFSRRIRLDDRVFWVEGPDRVNAYMFADDPLIREHAKWLLGLRRRHDRWPWWQLTPPPPRSTLRWLDIKWTDTLLGWLIALWALTVYVRRGLR